MPDPDLSQAFVGHGVAVAYLFGSRAEGTATAASDVDVAVLFAGDAVEADRTVRLAAAVSAVLDCPTDVVDLSVADLELRARVVQRGRLLHSDDEPRRVRFEVDTRSRWFDFEPVLRETTASYLRRVATAGLR